MTALASLAGGALAIAGCGGGGGGGGGGGATKASTSGAAGRAARATAAATDGQQWITGAERALDGLHSFHIHEAGTEDGQYSTLDGDVQLPGRIRVTLGLGSGQRVQLVLIGRRIYIHGNRRFWRSKGVVGAHRLTRLTGRWEQLPASAIDTVFGARIVKALDPATAGLCLPGPDFGSPAIAGHAMVDGRPAVVVSVANDAPGAFRGRLEIATAGLPLPLREVQTSPNRPGGSRACGPVPLPDSEDRDVTDLTDFNERIEITVLGGALSPNSSQAAGIIA